VVHGAGIGRHRPRFSPMFPALVALMTNTFDGAALVPSSDYSEPMLDCGLRANPQSSKLAA
jgi:hypothetical protein